MDRCSRLLVALLLLSSPLRVQSAETAKAPSVHPSGFAASLPLAFELNQGQTDPQVRYLTRGPGYSLYLTNHEAVLVLQLRTDSAPPVGGRAGGPRQQVFRLQLQDASPEPQVIGEGALLGFSNYFNGSNPANWRTHIPNFARVRLPEIYPGIDLVYYGNSGQLEYDFRIKAGADLSRIALRVSGVDKLFLDAKGNLVLKAGDSEVRNQSPIIYQQQAGRRIFRTGHYVIRAGNTVGFQVEDYDRSKPLVIDPILRYSTYLGGGSGGSDPFGFVFNSGLGIAVDVFGFAYVVGNTTTVDFPTTSGSFEPVCPAAPLICTFRYAVFVTKLNRAGTQLVYSTYLTSESGTGFDVGSGKLIAVDRLGNAHIAGTAFGGPSSAEFPTTTTALQRVCAFENDSTCAFYTKLNFDGSQLLYSTYYGTQTPTSLRETTGTGLALDLRGNAYLTGITEAPDLITTPDAFQQTFGGGSFDAFVAKFDPRRSGEASLVYGTYLGSSGDDQGSGIAVDDRGNAYVVGTTNSNQFPHTRSFGTGTGGTFLVKLSLAGRSLLYSSLLHGAAGTGIALDSSRNALITGGAVAQGFPTTPRAFHETFAGGVSDAFVTKFNDSGSAIVYSTFFGGNGDDIGNGIALDAKGHAFITGKTSSTNFCVTREALQATRRGSSDAFVTEFFVSGRRLVFSTYFGGSSNESGNDIAVDPLGSAYITGRTESTDLNVTSGAFQKTNHGAPSSTFVAKLVDRGRSRAH